MFGKKKGNDPGEWTKTGSFVHKPSRGWLHSEESLGEGGVSYAVKYVGCIQVLKSMRTLQYDMRQQVTREAILRCCETAGYVVGKRKKASKQVAKLLVEIPNMRHSGSSINLTVSATGIKMVTIDSGKVIGNHDMQGISFASGGEKEWIDMVGYVAKDTVNGRACHVFDCGGGLAYDVINTIGQAFEIRYKMFLQNPPQAMQVPERFSETIFGDESTYNEVGDAAAGGMYAEPRSEAPVKKPEYQVPKPAIPNAYSKLKQDPFEDMYDNPGMKVPSLVPLPAGYDVPKGIKTTQASVSYSNPDANKNTMMSTTSFEVAPGALYDLPEPGTATYDNPLASVGRPPTVPLRHDSLNDKHHVVGEQYDTPNAHVVHSDQTRKGWATFDEDQEISPTPPPPPMATHPEFNKPAAKKPPPLPKPYAETKNKSKKPQGLQMGEVQNALPNQPQAASRPDPLRDSEWFHGQISRAEAELLLEDEGDFLVRESKSQPGQFVLSGVQNGHPRHLLLVDPLGQVRTKDKVFESVEQLIAYHRENDLPIISSGSSVKINHPVINVK